MTPSTLHAHAKESLRGAVSGRRRDGFRFILESGTAEGFLRDLLAIELHVNGYRLTRELPTPAGVVDLVVHEDVDTYIEAKQLHLMNGPRYGANLVRDLERHADHRCLGIVYLLDERQSGSELKYPRFRGANRRAKCSPQKLMEGLQRFFPLTYPGAENQALISSFKGAGHVDVYAFVVSLHNEAP